VIETLQTNKENLINLKPVRPKKILTKKLIDLKIEEIPAKCKEKITRSNDLLKELLERGG